MLDFQAIAKILAVTKAAEDSPVFNCALVEEKTLRMTSRQRDRIALMLQKEGYIQGLYVIDGIDNMELPVIIWNHSKPSLTLKGMEYMRENSHIRKAFEEMKDASIAVASQTLANAIVALNF